MKKLALLFALLLSPLLAWPTPPCVIANSGRTRSMGDVFPPGATAGLQAATAGADVTGYVLAMRDEAHGVVICHRCLAQGVAANGGRWYVTKGDANMQPDFPRWSEAELLGVLDLPRKAR